jgi:hypothetical protein
MAPNGTSPSFLEATANAIAACMYFSSAFSIYRL